MAASITHSSLIFLRPLILLLIEAMFLSTARYTGVFPFESIPASVLVSSAFLHGISNGTSYYERIILKYQRLARY